MPHVPAKSPSGITPPPPLSGRDIVIPEGLHDSGSDWAEAEAEQNAAESARLGALAALHDEIITFTIAPGGPAAADWTPATGLTVTPGRRYDVADKAGRILHAAITGEELHALQRSGAGDLVAAVHAEYVTGRYLRDCQTATSARELLRRIACDDDAEGMVALAPAMLGALVAEIDRVAGAR